MSHAQKHTVVRISLRSMLAITFGVAVVMAVAGPYINVLDAEKKWQLLIILISMSASMAITTLFLARQRYRAGQQCGPLLVPLTREMKNRNKKWLRWFWLLVTVPVFIFYCFALSSVYGNSSKPFYLKLISLTFFPAFYSQLITLRGLTLWAEGYSDGFELCENGILIMHKFFAWNSPALRDMYWGQVEGKFVININRAPITTLVPPEQREAVDAILENYYRASRTTENRKST